MLSVSLNKTYPSFLHFLLEIFEEKKIAVWTIYLIRFQTLHENSMKQLHDRCETLQENSMKQLHDRCETLQEIFYETVT